MKYTVSLAKDIIDQIRHGKTLLAICKPQDMPDVVEIYDWMADPKCKIGKQSFKSVYDKACLDRALTWQDEAMEMHDQLTITGTREDHTQLKLIDAKAALRFRASREIRETMKATGGGGADAPTVVIKTFGRPAKADA